jgi:hypothetical protein
MVFVAVSQHQTPNPRSMRGQVIEARVVDVDTKIGRRKRHAAIDEKNVIALFEGHAVHPNLAQSAEWGDAQCRMIGCRIGRQRNAPKHEQ